MKDEIVPAEHAHWAPIPLGQDPEVIRQQYAAAFSATTPSADVYAAAIAGVATQLQESPGDGTVNLAAWARVRTPNEIDVLGYATLRVSPLAEGATRDDVLAMLTDGQELYTEPLVGDLATSSGDALTVRVRPLVRAEDGQVEVHQVNAVVWARPEHQAVFTLTSYETDLVEAVPAGDLLDELAVGIAGMEP